MGEGDYLNCPFTRDEYARFYEALVARRVGAGARLRQGEVLRGLPADRGDGAPRRRHAAVRADEAGRPRRSAHRPRAVRRGAAAAGQPRRRSLQPGRLPDADQVGRAGARAAADSRARAGRVRALRHGPPQHLRQRADGAARDLAGADPRRPVLRRPDVRRRGLRRVGGLGPAGRPERRRAGAGRADLRPAAHHGDRRARVLRVARRPRATTSRRTSRSASSQPLARAAAGKCRESRRIGTLATGRAGAGGP